MTIERRRYKLLGDFDRVADFLDQSYDLKHLNGYLLKPFLEYAHTHPAFDHSLTHRFGIWEENERIIGVVCYEFGLGQCFISVSKDHNELMSEMLNYAEKELSVIKDKVTSLGVWTTDKEFEKIKLLESRGYRKVRDFPVNIFKYSNEFPETKCPEGFEVISLNEENDIKKIHECLWKGFDHSDEPDDDIDCRLLMQSGPNFSKELTSVIKSPDGDYVCFAGMWFNESHDYAYLEPLATTPNYRKMGLGKLALVEGMKKTKALGAKYCFGGESDFYKRLGFKTIASRQLWFKEW